jgi:hypothetical protein
MHEIILKLKQTKYKEIKRDLNESHTRRNDRIESMMSKY